MKRIILLFFALVAFILADPQDNEQIYQPEQDLKTEPTALSIDSPLPTPQPTRPEPTAYPIPITASPTPPFTAVIAGTPQLVPGEPPQLPTVLSPVSPSEHIIVTPESKPTIDGN